MDFYAQKLAENLEVPKICTDIYQKSCELFNISFFSKASAKTLWRDICFVRRLNKTKGIIHFPNHHFGRYGLFLKIPYIITVHDLIRYFDLKGYSTFIHRPNFRDKVYLSLDYKGIKKAFRIIAVSETTKHDLIRHLGIPEERISVIYEGIDHRIFKPVKQRLVDFPYLLFVGSEHPRKNFIGLLKAFSRLKKEGFKDLKLIKVGKEGGAEANFREKTLKAIRELGLEMEVIFTEHVPGKDLPAYYSGAECFILPSYCEGFGFPLLEAMACGCPAIISNRASLPEISGGAAIEVDPDDEEELARALYRVLTEDELRKSLIRKGIQRAARFSWERTAQQTLLVYYQVEESLRKSRRQPRKLYLVPSNQWRTSESVSFPLKNPVEDSS